MWTVTYPLCEHTQQRILTTLTDLADRMEIYSEKPRARPRFEMEEIPATQATLGIRLDANPISPLDALSRTSRALDSALWSHFWTQRELELDDETADTIRRDAFLAARTLYRAGGWAGLPPDEECALLVAGDCAINWVWDPDEDTLWDFTLYLADLTSLLDRATAGADTTAEFAQLRKRLRDLYDKLGPRDSQALPFDELLALRIAQLS